MIDLLEEIDNNIDIDIYINKGVRPLKSNKYKIINTTNNNSIE